MDMDSRGPIDEEQNQKLLTASTTVLDWFVMEGGTPCEQDPEQPEIFGVDLRGTQYFIGYSTFTGDGDRGANDFASEVGALLYESPPFDRESLMSMISHLLPLLDCDPVRTFLEHGDEGLWVFRRLTDQEILDHRKLDAAVSDFVGIAEKFHAAVH